MKNSISLTLAFILASSVAATAEDLAVFDIGSLDGDPAGPLAPSTTASNVTGGNLVRGTGVTHDPDFNGEAGNLTNADGLYGAGDWPTAAEADPDSYFEFTVAPDANFSLAVESLSFTLFTEHVEDGEGGVWIGPEMWDFAYSLDGFSTSFEIDSGVATPAADLSGGDARYAQHSFDYTGLDIDVAEGETLSIRFFGYDRPEGTAIQSYGGFSNNADGDPAPGDGEDEDTGEIFDHKWVNNGSDIILTGAVIPEPSHVAAGIAGFALFVTLIIRRRRKQ